MSQIIPGVYLGCVNTATNRKFIIENNIRTIPILTEKISSNWSLGYSFKKLTLNFCDEHI